jgi:cation:H+ antiporter
VLFTLDRTMGRSLSMILLMLALAYLLWDYRAIRRIRAARQTPGSHNDREGLSRAIGLFSLGAVLIIGGSQPLVVSGQSVAAALGIPSAIIGFSVIAIGTSLPELVTGVSAARKGVPDLSLGNIIGANVLNLLLIIGLSGTIQPLVLGAFTQWYAFPWMGAFFGAVIVLVRRNGHVGARAGVGLLVAYVLYMLGLVVAPVLGLA